MKKLAQSDIGLIGLAVMGQNLTLNMEDKGYSVAVYNRTISVVDEFLKKKAKGKNIIGYHSLQDLCKSLKKPCLVMLMVKAGEPVDSIIKELIKHLEPSDIIIDGGNSHFKDTIRRSNLLKEKDLHYLGIGISGGEEGALKGPSIMIGGSEKAWNITKRLFQDISAKIDDQPCCSYLGPNGAGHFVKMVHNGIEYSDMQLIAESYFIMKKLLRLSPSQLESVYSEWNEGELNSYLIQITGEIFAAVDEETKKPLIDVILDAAAQKGTGKWTSQEALDIGVPVPSIAAAVFARNISGKKDERVSASKYLKGPPLRYSGETTQLIEVIRKALYAAKVCSYSQGFTLLEAASKEYGWNLNLGKIALIWQEGCIIRARFLKRIHEAFTRDQNLSNLLLDPYFADIIEQNQSDWRNILKLAIQNGIPVPAFSSALTYYDSYRSSSLPANLIQAQREYFGAHGFERIDKAHGIIFHHKFH